MGRNILVVEDDRNICDLIHMYLVKEGFDVRIAGDGGKAIEEFQKQVPDLILLDIMLPVMDGWSVCAKIRETSKVPIIMLTAKSEDADKLMGFECGADDYLTKPFNILELKARVRALLRRPAAEPGRRPDRGGLVPEHGGAGGHPGWKDRGSDRQGVRSDRAADAQSPAGVQPGEPDECGVGLHLRRRLPHGGCAYPPPAGKAGGRSIPSEIY